MSSGNAYEIHALSGAYAVDALDADEKVLFEQHLAACPACQAEVAGLREATASLAQSVEADPPPTLRDRVLADIRTVRPLPPEVESERPTKVRALPVRRRLTAFAVAAALLGVAGVGTVVWHQNSTSDQGRTSAADRILRASDAKRVSLALDGGGSASVVRSVSAGRAVLITRGMPSAPTDKVYELWLQTPAGTMVPAGLMSGGSRTVVLDGDATNATAAGITVEPKGGSESPTTAPIALFDFERAT
ncbi:MAG: anti-sigma factor [Propionibacteriales bacterium]|nr:anti-sigma factor [Propionibacteriales bacterium]